MIRKSLKSIINEAARFKSSVPNNKSSRAAHVVGRRSLDAVIDRLMKATRYNNTISDPQNPALEQAATLVEDVQNFFNLNHVRKFVSVGSELFDAFKPFIEKPSWWNIGRVLMGVGKVVVDDVEVWSHSYFDNDEWVFPYSPDFNQTILQILAKYPYKTMKTSEENSVIRFCEIDDVRFGWVFNTRMESIDHVWVEVVKLEKAQKIIKDLLWHKFHNQPLVMRNNRKLLSANDSRIVFEVDDAFHPLPSQRATDYSSYLKKCISADVPRSVMLYGPPGTGKSTMARTLVENLSLRSLRIRVEDVCNVENATLFEAITIFEPDAIILDDFDRANSQVQLMETLEFFQRHVKLVVATVNNMQNLDEALLRPGRFDELIEVDKMDEPVIKKVLGHYQDGLATVRDWPIAFIDEYVKRRKFMTSQEAAAATVELAMRVKRLDKYRTVDDTTRLLESTTVEKGVDDNDFDDTRPDDIKTILKLMRRRPVKFRKFRKTNEGDPPPRTTTWAELRRSVRKKRQR